MLSILVASNYEGVIGVNNELPWKISKDLKYFKKLTMNNTIFMGRKTFESIGRVLPKRDHIVITRNQDYKAPRGVKVIHSYEELKPLLSEDKEVFVVGGGEIFNDFIDKVDRVYITFVDVDVKGDTFFPIEKLDNFKEVKREKDIDEKSGIKLEFTVYDKK
ncbi:MAG: dihydrofolate reductase [Clostridium sp.]|nr:dihydrofolate reductase [Clostridium sp.]